MTRVFVSVGSNIEREYNVRSAVAALSDAFGELEISRVYESAAVGFSGAPFYNLVAAFDTELSPAEVLARLHRIEDAHGRKRRGKRFSDRTLDLDLLLYGTLVRDGEVELPRAEIRTNAFVLGPLAEIAGDVADPRSGERYRDLWAVFDRSCQPLVPVDLPGLSTRSTARRTPAAPAR